MSLRFIFEALELASYLYDESLVLHITFCTEADGGLGIRLQRRNLARGYDLLAIEDTYGLLSGGNQTEVLHFDCKLSAFRHRTAGREHGTVCLALGQTRITK